VKALQLEAEQSLQSAGSGACCELAAQTFGALAASDF
jgi:hypothetical protein